MKSHWKNNLFKNIKVTVNDKQLKMKTEVKSIERRKVEAMRKLDSILERDIVKIKDEDLKVAVEIIARLLVNVRTNQVLIGRKLGVPEHQRGYKRPEREVRDTDK